MNLDQDVRTMLRTQAERVAATPTIPHGTLRRVRIRKTLMAGSAALIAAALIVGGFAASRSLSNDAAPIQPAHEAEERGSMELDPSASPWGTVLRERMTATFVSPTHGYSFEYVDRGGLEPAKEFWDPESQPSPIRNLGGSAAGFLEEFDVVETGYSAFFLSASTKIPGGVSVNEWADEAVAKYLPAGCYGPRTQQERITIDGEPGRISQDCAKDVVATTVKDGRLYLFAMAHDAPTRDEARQVFEAWVNTIDLTPETAEVP